MHSLTFNSPAVRAFFPENAVGVLVRADGTAALLPTRDRAHKRRENFVSGSPRDRGGFVVPFDAASDAHPLAPLGVQATPSRPFFLLRRLPGGWIEPVHHDRDASPPRTEPHARLWREKRPLERPPALPDHPALSYRDVVRHAARVVEDWDGSRRPGRAPREVEQARRVLADFAALAREVDPVLIRTGLADLHPGRVKRAVDAMQAARDALDPLFADFMRLFQMEDDDRMLGTARRRGLDED